MTDIKKIRELSGWLTFELDTKILDPPAIRLRVKPIKSFEGILTAIKTGLASVIKLQYELVFECVQQWDLTQDGAPIPVNSETKRKYLSFLLGEKTKAGIFLYIEISVYACEIQNFYENEDAVN
jgi:hypothetical protein